MSDTISIIAEEVDKHKQVLSFSIAFLVKFLVFFTISIFRRGRTAAAAGGAEPPPALSPPPRPAAQGPPTRYLAELKIMGAGTS